MNHPLHRSGRTKLPHPAPTLGFDAESLRLTYAFHCLVHVFLQPCVWYMGLCNSFPLVGRLPSIPSASAFAVLFGNFVGTMQPSDCPSSFIIGLGLLTSPCGPLSHLSLGATIGSPSSRVRCFGACSGSSTSWSQPTLAPSSTTVLPSTCPTVSALHSLCFSRLYT